MFNLLGFFSITVICTSIRNFITLFTQKIKKNLQILVFGGGNKLKYMWSFAYFKTVANNDLVNFDMPLVKMDSQAQK